MEVRGDLVYSSSFNTVVSIPTPVTITSLAASSSADKVNITWTTTTELNVSTFGIERSFDGINFNKVVNIFASGTSTSTHFYSYRDDASKLNGTVYYRLKTLDKDGKFTFSGVKQVVLKSIKNVINIIYPNPLSAGQDIKLAYTFLKSGVVNVQVFSSFGKQVVNSNFSVTDGINTLSVSGKRLIPRIYYVSVRTDNTTAERISLILQ